MAYGTSSEAERGVTFDLDLPNEVYYAFAAFLVVFLIVQIVIKRKDG
jgi:hypothetical protein